MKSIVENCEGFEWDDGNSNKNRHLHRVSDGECEDVFFNLPLIVASDKKYSKAETRFFALGRTDTNRWLFVAFAVRNNSIRVISARDMTKSEIEFMPKKLKVIPIFNDETEEREFWAKENSTDFVDWNTAETVTLPKLKPTTRTISLRISEAMLEKIRLAANKRDVPYQSLIKMFLKERLDEEFKVSR